MNKNKSPWSSYGRLPEPSELEPHTDRPDMTFGAAARIARGRRQVAEYIQHALKEYADIRAGQCGYQKLVADALKPSPGPESIEERLRRLSDK